MTVTILAPRHRETGRRHPPRGSLNFLNIRGPEFAR
jgi:hypothetical protein